MIHVYEYVKEELQSYGMKDGETLWNKKTMKTKVHNFYL